MGIRASGSARPGKRVGGALYLHRDALDALSEAERRRMEEAALAAPETCWNVVKIDKDGVSFLQYQDFEAHAFPALLRSTRVANGAVEHRDYANRTNRPILHRKELLLSLDDPRRTQFAAVTRAAEDRGLFADRTRIGTEAQWLSLLAQSGLEIRGPRLAPTGAPDVAIARHKTALSRRALSLPMSLMVRLGLLTTTATLFDYGCGQGDDVSILSSNGFSASGWDPHYAPEAARSEADVVNLGYVLNVIEDAHERAETLAAAWRLARRVLTVSVMTSSARSRSEQLSHEDGVLTKRGTFQRYFSHNELRALVEKATGAAPITLAAGVVSAFRDKNLEQEALYRRRSRATLLADHAVLDFRAPARTPSAAPLRPSIRERLDEPLQVIWRCFLELGRTPVPSELPASVLQRLDHENVSAARAIGICLREVADIERLRQVAAARKDDLIVYFGLMLFPGAPKYGSLPEAIRRDVKSFFVSHAAMLSEAKAALFALGDGRTVTSAAAQVVEQGLGGVRGEKIRFVSSVLPRLPMPIRLLIGCAEILEPDLGSADFLDVYPEARRVRGVWCDDASARAPALTEVADISLTRLHVRRRNRAGEVLYGKGSFLPYDDPDKASQAEFDQRLVENGLVTPSWDGPSSEQLQHLAEAVAWLNAALSRSSTTGH